MVKLKEIDKKITSFLNKTLALKELSTLKDWIYWFIFGAIPVVLIAQLLLNLSSNTWQMWAFYGAMVIPSEVVFCQVKRLIKHKGKYGSTTK